MMHTHTHTYITIDNVYGNVVVVIYSTWQLLQMLSINMWVWEQVNASVQQHEEMAR